MNILNGFLMHLLLIWLYRANPLKLLKYCRMQSSLSL